jgi:phage terminase small subunit
MVVNGLALNQKQEKFCLAYAKSGNARQSYLEAGYKCKPETADASASQLLKNPKVQDRLAELYDKAANESIADIREMQEVLTSIIRKEMDEEIIVVEGDGDGCSSARRIRKEPSLKDLINAINTLGKMQGAFTANLNVTGTVPVVIVDDVGEE